MNKKVTFLVILFQLSIVSAQTGEVPFFSFTTNHILENGNEHCHVSSWNAGYTGISDLLSISLLGNYNTLDTNEPFFSGKISGISFGMETGFRPISVSFMASSSSSDKITLASGKTSIHLDTITNTFLKTGLSINTQICVKPFLLYDTFSSEDGSFYFFKGKVSDGVVKAGGLEADYQGHTLKALYGTAGTDILNPLENLYTGHTGVSFYTASYDFTYRTNTWSFTTGIGYTGIEATLSISLLPENQKYLGFPFKYMNYAVNGRADIISFTQKNILQKKNSTLNIDITGFFCINSLFTENRNWLYQTYLLYNGSSGYTITDFNNLEHTAVILPEIGYTTFAETHLGSLGFSVSKLFPLAFSLNNPGKTDIASYSSSGTSTADDSSIIDYNLGISLNVSDMYPSLLWYLLSGTSLSITLKY